jgi:hypothetical protein
MNCPRCNTQNDPTHRFCKNCGEMLHQQTPAPAQQSQMNQQSFSNKTASEVLGIQTVRIVIALLGLTIVNLIFSDLDFVKELSIPNFSLSTPNLIRSMIYLIGVVLVIGYAQSLAKLWPRAYPKYGDVVVIFIAVVSVVALAMAYSGIRPVLQAFATDSTPFTILQIVFVVIALFVVIRACIIVYKKIPSWVDNLSCSVSLNTETPEQDS